VVSEATARGGLVFKAHGLCVSLNSRLESTKEEEKKQRPALLLDAIALSAKAETERAPVMILKPDLLPKSGLPRDRARSYRGTSLIRNARPP